MIVGIDTIASDDGGHRGTGGGGGEEQGGIVGEGEENIRRETLCTSAGWDMRWAGRCMYVSMCIRYDVWDAAYVYLYLLRHLHWSWRPCRPPSLGGGSRSLSGPYRQPDEGPYSHPTITEGQRERERKVRADKTTDTHTEQQQQTSKAEQAGHGRVGCGRSG